MPSKSRLNLSPVPLTIIVLVMLYALNYLVTPILVGRNNLELHCRPAGNREFESEAWKDLRGGGDPRYEMVDDLLASQSLAGRTESEIDLILGPPDSVTMTNGATMRVYYLAAQRRFPAKSVFFPGLFPNHEAWMLKIYFREGRAMTAKVFFT